MDDFNGTYNYQPQQPQVPTPPPVQNTPIQPKQGNGMATASLVLGICSIVFVCCCGGFVLGGLGIILALLSRGASTMNSSAKVGVGLSIGGMVLSLIALPIILLSNDFQGALQDNGWYYDYNYNFNYDDYHYYDLEDDLGEFFQNLPGDA